METIKNLVFEGGGVRGIAYIGALRVLDETQILKNVECVGGASVGAITALLIGLGYTTTEIETILRDEVKLSEFKDKVALHQIPGNKALCKGDKFYTWVKKKVEQKLGSDKATFADLRSRLIVQRSQPESYHNPYRLREMRFIGANISTGYYEVFSCDKTEHMPIADAVRISMSYPFLFAPFQATHQGHDTKQGHYYVDGGLLKNYPVDLFDENPQKPNLATLGFRIDLPDEISLLAYKQNPVVYPIDSFGSFVKAFVRTTLNNETNIHRNSFDDVRTVYINTKDVQTTDFDLKPEKFAELIQEGEKATREFLKHPRLISSHPLQQTQINQRRLQQYDQAKLYEKAQQIYYPQTTISPSFIQWVFKFGGEPSLKHRQKVDKYAKRLFNQPHIHEVKYAETADFDHKDYVITITTDHPKAIKHAQKYEKKYQLKRAEHMVNSKTLVPLGFWRQRDQLISYKDTLPQMLFEAVGDIGKDTDLTLLDKLLKQGVSTTYRDDRGRTALHQAARLNRIDAIKLLLSANADIQATDYYGDTPLHRTARYGQFEAMQELLKHIPDINVANKYGNTPLHLATAWCESLPETQEKCIQLLLSNNADATAHNNIQKTPKEWAEMLREIQANNEGNTNKGSEQTIHSFSLKF